MGLRVLNTVEMFKNVFDRDGLAQPLTAFLESLGRNHERWLVSRTGYGIMCTPEERYGSDAKEILV